jgi:hypothetical protein
VLYYVAFGSPACTLPWEADVLTGRILMTLLRNRAKALQLDYLLTNADHNAINFWKKAPRRLDRPPACARGCAALSARLLYSGVSVDRVGPAGF